MTVATVSLSIAVDDQEGAALAARVLQVPIVVASVETGHADDVEQVDAVGDAADVESAVSAVWNAASAGPMTVPSSPAVVASRATVASPGVVAEAAVRLSMKAERPLITAGAKRGSVAVIDRFAKVSRTALFAAGWMTSMREARGVVRRAASAAR